MTPSFSKKTATLVILGIWMVTILLPCVQVNVNDTVAVVEFEHNEQEAEGAGRLDEAVALFKRFIRLSPALAHVYGM